MRAPYVALNCRSKRALTHSSQLIGQFRLGMSLMSLKGAMHCNMIGTKTKTPRGASRFTRLFLDAPLAEW
jgi:hypothetical protein